MSVKLCCWGAAEEVTGSKHVLDVDGVKIMIDCGAFQGRRDEAAQKNREWPISARSIDVALLTHAHYDHCGLLPVLIKKGYEGVIYATPASRDLASLVMMDSAHIQAMDFEYLQKRNRKGRGANPAKPLYNERDVVNTLDHFMTVSYDRRFPIGGGVTAQFLDAGHILGSASIVLEIERDGGEPMRIGFSGDIGRWNRPILRDPKPLPQLDYLVCESTYGDRRHGPIESAMDSLAEVINRTVERGGKVVVPSFAIGRTQELVYMIHLLTDQQKIPSVPVYVDSPMATNATGIFRVHQECYDDATRQAFLDHHKNPFGFNELRYVSSVRESKELCASVAPAVIISASGMCEAGRILHHLRATIEDARNTILVVGFMGRHTLGRKIVEGQERVPIFGEAHALKAEVLSINQFSAHADYEEIRQHLDSQDRQRLRGIFLVHGEPEPQAHMTGVLQEAGFPGVAAAKYGQEYELE